MATQKKTRKTTRKTTRKPAKKSAGKQVKESASKVWLAGLGAVAMAEEEGGKLFQGLVAKGKEFEEEGRERIEQAMERVEKLAGKAKKRVETATSDVDLMIVGSVDMDQLDTILRDLEKDLGREINYVLCSRSEFKAKRKKQDGFVMGVLSGEKVILIGNESEFGAT